MTEVEAHAEFAAALAAAGWSVDRRVETRAAVAAWSERDYTISDAAVDFVASFDGISLQYAQTFPGGSGRSDSCVLNAAEATGAIFEPVVRSYENRVSETLCPIGLAASRHLVLLMAPSGKTYGGYDSFLSLYGEDGYEAVCRIFNRIKGLPVP